MPEARPVGGGPDVGPHARRIVDARPAVRRLRSLKIDILARLCSKPPVGLGHGRVRPRQGRQKFHRLLRQRAQRRLPAQRRNQPPAPRLTRSTDGACAFAGVTPLLRRVRPVLEASGLRQAAPEPVCLLRCAGSWYSHEVSVSGRLSSMACRPPNENADNDLTAAGLRWAHTVGWVLRRPRSRLAGAVAIPQVCTAPRPQPVRMPQPL